MPSVLGAEDTLKTKQICKLAGLLGLIIAFKKIHIIKNYEEGKKKNINMQVWKN